LIPEKHATRNLFLLGSIFLTLGEVSFVTIVFTPTATVRFSLQVEIAWIYLFGATALLFLASKERFAVPLFPRIARLVQDTNDPHRASVWMQLVYSTLGFVNSPLPILGFTAALITKNWNPAWGVFAGIATILSIFYNRFIFSAFGQRYEDSSGSSFVVAASLAKLSSKILSKQRRQGLAPLLQSLAMTDRLFVYRQYRPKLIPAVQTTAEGLVDLERDQLSFNDLRKLADALTQLPRREGLPTAFEQFLNDMKWPGGFETVRREHVSIYNLATILILAATAIGSLLLLVPRQIQDDTYNAISSFLLLQGANVIGLGRLLAGTLYWSIVLKYDTYFRLLLDYM
jgi:hypothetical protein